MLYDGIFVGIVTCSRPQFFLKCLDSVPECLDLSIVNDGVNFTPEDIAHMEKKRFSHRTKFKYTHNKENLGVAKSKNILFRQFLESKNKYCIIMEDDIVAKDYRAFNMYVLAYRHTGIHHFNFGYHGPANKGGISKGTPQPRFIVDYGNNIKVAINQHSVGAFCFYTRTVLEKVGLIDENLKNSFDHVELDYRMAKAGYIPPYWNFPDLANSCDYLEELECSENSSTIRGRADWQKNIQESAEYFKQKHGVLPAWQGCVPDTSKEDVIKILKEIKKKYAKV
jgi:GT2 family glycosyltransferase